MKLSQRGWRAPRVLQNCSVLFTMSSMVSPARTNSSMASTTVTQRSQLGEAVAMEAGTLARSPRVKIIMFWGFMFKTREQTDKHCI